ncbi:hypothetical protein N7456_000903 [Penicillium angulare]|uniref:Uncharacterized protein n=1 Tax=Penicillium angulare TaxID=116970 RepID=A0A9W9KSJ7_9EURO|nr:hypothetical protein N7456_000903 [Penicillium angulare]
MGLAWGMLEQRKAGLADIVGLLAKWKPCSGANHAVKAGLAPCVSPDLHGGVGDLRTPGLELAPWSR